MLPACASFIVGDAAQEEADRFSDERIEMDLEIFQ